ncbi:Patatin/Phospholipase A2-like protein [Ceratocystis lukuohia]|uniref:Patatin/Phospholipase A2-like protein n=1 Tax=Ceratocystis lukuohia TaxID=2019550 RepID=A0ABR4MHB4_9PEZI
MAVNSRQFAETPRPAKVLSIDGGGVRGLSALLILEKMMQGIQQSRNLATTPKPCHEFDLIGGLLLHSVIAIMLGRMGMSVDECIRAYTKFSKKAFHRKMSILGSTSAFSATKFNNAIKTAIQDHGGNPEDLLFCDPSCTKTAVLAVTKNNVDTLPILFKTYGQNDDNISDCKAWEVARATTAAVGFFKSVKIGRDNIEYIDAAFGHNNPCEMLIAEATKQFPGRGLVVLSIGTGIGDVIEINEARPIAKALENMATSSKHAAMRMKTAYSDSNAYHRFNVESGLKDITLWDWERTSQISAHTKNYLRENEEAVKKFMDVMAWISAQQHVLELDG